MDRARDAFEASERRRLDREGESKDDRAIRYHAFFEGWRAREEAANLRYADDFAILLDEMNHLRELGKQWQDHALKYYLESLATMRRHDALRDQILYLKANPLDAPIYRRVTNQRAEIKRLQKLVDEHPDTP